MNSLVDELKQVPDFRSAHGRYHPLWVVLLLVVMGTMAGYRGYRPLQHFVESHHEALCELLGLKRSKFPSYSTFRRILMGIDFEHLCEGFERWMDALESPLAEGEAVAIDAKRICQPITDQTTGQERFVGLVSVFTQAQGLTLKLQALSQSDNSELKVVQCLLESLHLKGAIVSMDALHAQKNTPVSA